MKSVVWYELCVILLSSRPLADKNRIESSEDRQHVLLNTTKTAHKSVIFLNVLLNDTLNC
jgi:hypothetical protein